MSDTQAQSRRIETSFKAVLLDVEAAESAGADKALIALARRHITDARYALEFGIVTGHDDSRQG